MVWWLIWPLWTLYKRFSLHVPRKNPRIFFYRAKFKMASGAITKKITFDPDDLESRMRTPFHTSQIWGFQIWHQFNHMTLIWPWNSRWRPVPSPKKSFLIQMTWNHVWGHFFIQVKHEDSKSDTNLVIWPWFDPKIQDGRHPVEWKLDLQYLVFIFSVVTRRCSLE